jgi:hypothetical protein
MTVFYGIRNGIERSTSRSQNIQTREVLGMVSRSVPSPTPAIRGVAGNVSPTPKLWQAFPDAISHAQAAVAFTLHPLRLVDRQQGIRHESVIAEHSVVVPSFAHPGSVIPGGKQ